MSIEGMWAVYFGDVGERGQINSGIAVLETGRIFGGDSMMAYLGNYAAKDGSVTGELKVWAYNPNQVVTTAFGTRGTKEGDILGLRGDVNANATEIRGQLWVKAHPQAKIPARLVKVAELPG